MFPCLDVGKIMLHLDSDGDELVTPEEFRSCLLGEAHTMQLVPSGVYFGVVGESSWLSEETMALFPKRLMPLLLQDTVALGAADIIVDMADVSRWWSEEWPCEINHDSLGRREDLQRIVEMLPTVAQAQCEAKVLRGCLSPL